MVIAPLDSARSCSFASTLLQNILYSASLAAYSFAMIFGATVLGQLSDRIGRTRTLGLALIGSLAGYLVCGAAVALKMPMLFLLGRFVGGLFAGSVPVAQVALLDMKTKENRMTGIGLGMFAVTSGYIFDPIGTDFVVNVLFGRPMWF
ncbi:MAG: major facilitator superfamily permease [Rhodospirillaceae bacterium]|nr:MAG: major facilitator superfamily permease [Rhodospirillaceae bacterium]